MGNLGRIAATRKTGAELFRMGDRDLGFDLLGFWQWSASDIVSNATRGRLAEYIIANAIGAATGVRDEWAAFDLEHPDGISIEVKSSAYIQSWNQRELSKIAFNCPKTLAWDPETNKQSDTKQRQAEVYIFALQFHEDQATLDPFDIEQWRFYVVPTVVLDRRERSQHSITLKSLEELPCAAVSYDGLNTAVVEAAEVHRAVAASG